MAVVFCIVLVLFFVIIIFAVFSMRQKDDDEETVPPTHFDLLDENGDPLPKEQVVQELKYFCLKDKGYHVSVWPKDAGMQNLDYIEFEIAGMTYRSNLDKYIGEHAGTLEPEPTNPYDSNAIKILASDGHHVGYVPKDMTDEIRRHAQLPCTCYFYIGENDGTYFSNCYIRK